MISASRAHAVDSAGIARAIASTDFSACSATVIGHGYVGKEYVKALRALRVGRIRVCGRSAERLQELRDVPGVETFAEGFDRLSIASGPDELGIIGIPTACLASAARKLADLGFRRLLIEKPVALRSSDIAALAGEMERKKVDALAAYNRVAYPSLLEVRARAELEGGITSCTYTFTEMIKPNWQQIFPREELARWGIANSLHVMSLAHGLIGMPREFQAHWTARGRIPWHPAGEVFVGSGISERGIPFGYHADWGSTGRWSVQVSTPVSSYLFRPLEEARRRTAPMAEWEVIPVKAHTPEIKPGFLEEVAAALKPELRTDIPLCSLSQAAELAAYGEKVFGYDRT